MLAKRLQQHAPDCGGPGRDEKSNCQGFGDIVCCECAVGHGAFDENHDEMLHAANSSIEFTVQVR